MLASFLHYLREKVEYQGSIYISIRKWAETSTHPAVSSALVDFVKQWDILERHKLHLEGGFETGKLTIGEVLNDWWAGLQLVCRADGSDAAFLQDRPFGTNYTVEAVAAPHILVPPDQISVGGYYGIGAEALSEGFALGQEMDFLWHAKLEKSSEVEERRWMECPTVPYKVAWDYVSTVASGECQVGTWVAALSDLAFCGPIDIYQLSRGRGPICWEDIHPGWRFARAVHAAKKLGLLAGPWTHRSWARV